MEGRFWYLFSLPRGKDGQGSQIIGTGTGHGTLPELLAVIIICEPEPNVAVRVRRRVVGIEEKSPSTRAVVPIPGDVQHVKALPGGVISSSLLLLLRQRP